jgi:flagellar hook-basal body complex protein FliE
VVSPLIAAKAYAAAQGSSSPTGGAQKAGATGFAEILQNTLGQTTQATRQAEHMMASQVAGKAELVDVVTAVASAEASLETVIAVRDQVIQAYQEIMRMPI